MKVLLTGMTGFTGARLAEEILGTTDWEIYSLERTSNRTNLMGALAFSPRIHRLYHDFRAELPARITDKLADSKYIFHVGAEVHGMRSVEDPELFIQANVMGTFNLLEAARKIKPDRFVYLSSGEAVGSAPKPLTRDTDSTLQPSNPYAGAKAAAEMLVNSYAASFAVSNLIVRTTNIFGERQDTSKFLPACIKKVLRGEELICHVNEKGEPGSRQWIYVGNLVNMIMNGLWIMERPYSANIGKSRKDIFHLVGPELTNLEIIHLVEKVLGKKACVSMAQPGRTHDMRYSLEPTGGAISREATIRHLEETITFYAANQEWLE